MPASIRATVNVWMSFSGRFDGGSLAPGLSDAAGTGGFSVYQMTRDACPAARYEINQGDPAQPAGAWIPEAGLEGAGASESGRDALRVLAASWLELDGGSLAATCPGRSIAWVSSGLRDDPRANALSALPAPECLLVVTRRRARSPGRLRPQVDARAAGDRTGCRWTRRRSRPRPTPYFCDHALCWRRDRGRFFSEMPAIPRRPRPEDSPVSRMRSSPGFDKRLELRQNSHVSTDSGGVKIDVAGEGFWEWRDASAPGRGRSDDTHDDRIFVPDSHLRAEEPLQRRLRPLVKRLIDREWCGIVEYISFLPPRKLGGSAQRPAGAPRALSRAD